MGPHKDFKLPPYAVFKYITSSGEEKWVIEPSLLPEGCVPYLIFVNKRAGGQQGKIVFRSMLSLFNPHQVPTNIVIKWAGREEPNLRIRCSTLVKEGPCLAFKCSTHLPDEVQDFASWFVEATAQ